jgi:hypothetical protein
MSKINSPRPKKTRRHDDDLRTIRDAAMRAILAACGSRVADLASLTLSGVSAGHTTAAIYISATPNDVAADCAAARAYIEARVAEVYAAMPGRHPDDGARECHLRAPDQECLAINAPGGDA